MKSVSFIIVGIVIALAGCNQNTAIGNDREAELEPPAAVSPVEPAQTALQNVSTALIKPETMSQADIEAIGGTEGKCVFTLTEIGYPAFVFETSRTGAIKLNGKLVPVAASGDNRYTSGELLISTRLLDDTGNAGLRSMELIVVPPGAKDALSYRGYVACPD